MTLPPPLELFRKFIRFGRGKRPLLINIKPLPSSDFLAVQIESKDNSMGDLDTFKKHKNRPIQEINE